MYLMFLFCLAWAAMIYFIINFTLSCIVRSMQQRRIKAVPAADRASQAAIRTSEA